MYLWQEPNLSASLGHEGVTGVAPTEEVHWKISSSPSANGRLVHDPLCTIHSSCRCCLHKLQLFFSRETHRPVFRPLHQPAVDFLMSIALGLVVITPGEALAGVSFLFWGMGASRRRLSFHLM